MGYTLIGDGISLYILALLLWQRAVEASVLRPNASRAAPLAYQALAKLGINLYGLIVSLDGLIVIILRIGHNTFVEPGIGIVGIEPECLVKSFDGLIVFSLVSQRSAFVCSMHWHSWDLAWWPRYSI